MWSSFSVGRIFGIEIPVDYSWFIIFILIAWSRAVGCFPSGYYWGVALVTSLLIFIASVLDMSWRTAWWLGPTGPP